MLYPLFSRNCVPMALRGAFTAPPCAATSIPWRCHSIVSGRYHESRGVSCRCVYDIPSPSGLTAPRPDDVVLLVVVEGRTRESRALMPPPSQPNIPHNTYDGSCASIRNM